MLPIVLLVTSTVALLILSIMLVAICTSATTTQNRQPVAQPIEVQVPWRRAENVPLRERDIQLLARLGILDSERVRR